MTIEISETVIAGGADDFVEARHLVLRGTNREIGRALGGIARERSEATPLRPPDAVRARATRHYFHEHYPIHAQRVLGARDVYGGGDIDGVDIIGLPCSMPPPGCSVAYIPPSRSATGGGLFSRYYDTPLEYRAPSHDPERLGASANPPSTGVRLAAPTAFHRLRCGGDLRSLRGDAPAPR